MTWLQHIIHYGLHFVAPIGIAIAINKASWKGIYFILVATMLIDLDHLLATPIFDAQRCSIGFHPLHSYIAIGAYIILLFIPKTKIIGIGLLFHIFTDGIDCLLNKINI